MKLTPYQKYVQKFAEKVSNLTTKRHSIYRLMPKMMSEQEFNMTYEETKLMYSFKEYKNTNYVRDIIAAQFKEWKSGGKTIDAVLRWQNEQIKEYAQRENISLSKAKSFIKDTYGLITRSDIMYHTELGERFYNDVKRTYRELRNNGVTSYDAESIIGQEFFGSD